MTNTKKKIGYAVILLAAVAGVMLIAGLQSEAHWGHQDAAGGRDKWNKPVPAPYYEPKTKQFTGGEGGIYVPVDNPDYRPYSY